jgi:hypothetical protein
MVKVVFGPEQPDAKGVTVIVEVTGDNVVLIPLNAAIFPEPETGRPMVALVFVQLNDVGVTEPLNTTAAVDAPLQTDWFVIAYTVGVGLIVILKL